MIILRRVTYIGDLFFLEKTSLLSIYKKQMMNKLLKKEMKSKIKYNCI